MSTVFNLRAALEDGTSFDVQADQRDIAAFELSPDGVPAEMARVRILSYLRFMAWNAGRRRKLHTLTWEQWKDECVEVVDLDEGGPEAPEPDPGQPEASAGS